MKFFVTSCLLALTDTQLCFRSANHWLRHHVKDILLPCLHQVTLIFHYSNIFFQSWTEACSLLKEACHFIASLFHQLLFLPSCFGCRWICNFSYIHCFREDHSWVCWICFKAHKLVYFDHIFLSKVLKFLVCRYGGGMSSAKAALESDTRVSFFFFFFSNFQIMCM